MHDISPRVNDKLDLFTLHTAAQEKPFLVASRWLTCRLLHLPLATSSFDEALESTDVIGGTWIGPTSSMVSTCIEDSDLGLNSNASGLSLLPHWFTTSTKAAVFFLYPLTHSLELRSLSPDDRAATDLGNDRNVAAWAMAYSHLVVNTP